MWMSPAAATFLCAIAGTRAVFLLFTFLLQYFSRTIARAHRERERENGRRQIFTRPASKSSLPSFAPSSSKFFVGLVRRSRRNKHQTLPSRKAPLIVLNAIDNLDIARMYTRGATRMLAGDLTDRAIFVEQRGHRLASSGQGALVLPPVPSSPPLVFETLKLPGCSNSWGRVLIVNRRGSRKDDMK